MVRVDGDMKLADIFTTPTIATLLDLLLTRPRAVYTQTLLSKELKRDVRAVRRAVSRLEALGLVEVGVNPVEVRIKVVKFNDETELGRAVLAFYRHIAVLQPESKGDE
jgi:DNA-binding MarR family transcriptional regulator